MSASPRYRGVDFHCHLDLFPDHEAAIARAEAASVFTLTVTTTPKAWPRNFNLTRTTRNVRAALGLHPQLAADRASELSLWERYLPQTRYVGEVGLDAGPRFYKSLDVQQRVFRTVLQRCAEVGGKILTVHSVRSTGLVLDMVEQYLPPSRGVVILHWFTGSRGEAKRAEALGCYFSVNAEMVRSKRGRDLVAELPAKRLLTETDGPFTNIGDRPSEPADSVYAVHAIARARGTCPNIVSNLVTANLHTLLQTTRGA